MAKYDLEGSIKSKAGGKSKGKKKHWIQGAIKHPGAEKKAAKRSGMSTHAFMEKNKNKSGTAGKRARLGLALSKMSKRRKGKK